MHNGNIHTYLYHVNVIGVTSHVTSVVSFHNTVIVRKSDRLAAYRKIYSRRSITCERPVDK